MFLVFLQRFPFWKLVKFIITGGIALGIDVAIYYLLTRYGQMYYLLARALSLGVAIVWSFTVNRQWTFRATEGDARKQVVKFVIVILTTSLLSLGLMHIGVTVLHFHDLAVILVVSVITTLINFSAHFLWSYAENKETREGWSVQSIVIEVFKKINLKSLSLLTLLFLFEVSIHPLGLGPDRRIHDPAVYRLADPGYMTSDWYTTMAVESGVYTFYAKLVNAYQILPVSEEFWRMALYLLSLGILYFSLIKIAQLFSESALVVPIVAFFHAIVVVVAPPIWLYGPFIQVDGGLAPRSIGIALSFLALYFLLKQSQYLPWALLGIATLVHVSNSLIVFTLFFGAWFFLVLLNREITITWKEYLMPLFRQMGIAFLVYLFAGGWFALSASLRNTGVSDFPDEKFIWVWIYFRAPYMALPLMPWKAWLLFGLHIGAFVTSWYLLRRWSTEIVRKMLDLLALIGLGATIYFFAFYIFAFIFPWLPGFQFYSLRVIYLMYFGAYFFSALVLVRWLKRSGMRWILFLFGCLAFIMAYTFMPVQHQMKKMVDNVKISIGYLFNQQTLYTLSPTAKTLTSLKEPFLAPPNWYGSPWYLPSVVSYKMFGFTPQGLKEWYERMESVSDGELERAYLAQKKTGSFRPVMLDWNTLYTTLSTEDVQMLSGKYHFSLFLASVKSLYPFEVVAEDSDYRLYRITDSVSH